MKELLNELGFDDPTIKFVLHENKNYIVGVCNDSQSYVCFLNDKRVKVILENEIKIKRKYKSDVVESLESFLLMKLNQGYEIAYFMLSVHFSMWDFIDYFIEEVDIFSIGVVKYLNYCIRTGISYELIDNYGYFSASDLITILTKPIYWDYHILIKEKVGNNAIMLMKKISDNLFKVVVINENNQELFSDYHGDIDNAFKDFNNYFFGLSNAYYRQLENEHKLLISEFKEENDE